MAHNKRDPTVTERLGRAFKAIHDKDERRCKALGLSVGSAGGYTVAPELVVNIDSFLNEVGVFHQYAQRYSMTESELHVGGVNTSKTTSGESPMFGGLTMGWAKEGSFGALTADPTFDLVKFVAVDMLGGILTVPNQMLADGQEVGLGQYLENLLRAALEWYVEKACWVGLGIAAQQPVGVVNNESTHVVTRSGSTTVVAADVTGLIKGLFPASYDRAIWGANPSVIPKLAVISGYQVANPCCDTSRLAGSLMGRPLFVTEKLPTLGTRGDLTLFDPLLYGLAVRQLEVESSGHSKFSQNMTDFRVIWRGDGRSLVSGTATLEDDTTVVGAAAVLSTNVA